MRSASATRHDSRAWAPRIARIVLFGFGVGAIVYVVHDAGPDRVWQTLLGAGLYVPAIVALEAAFMSMDVLSLRALLGASARGVPTAVWVRSGLMAYAIMILFPGGRAAGEVARATALAPFVGGARAAAYGTRLQAATMLGNTTISIPCGIACFSVAGATAALPWLVLGNGAITAGIAAAIVLASRTSRIGGWLGARIRGLAAHGERFDEALRDEASWSLPVLFSALGRAIQTVQYGLILVAVGGALTPIGALVSQGIHLVGAGLGDLVPNQAGITEGAYWMFAEALGLGAEPAAAVGIALVARSCQYVLAAVGLIAGAASRGTPRPESASEP